MHFWVKALKEHNFSNYGEINANFYFVYKGNVCTCSDCGMMHKIITVNVEWMQQTQK